MRSGFESRGGCGGQVKVKVDRHIICDTGGERIAEYFALLDEGDMMFCDEIVVKDRVGVRCEAPILKGATLTDHIQSRIQQLENSM